MNAHDVIAQGLSDCTGHDAESWQLGALFALSALEDAGYAVVKLPKPDDKGDFGSVRLSTWSDGTDINVATRWYPPDVARVLAAKLLAAANLADQIDGKK